MTKTQISDMEAIEDAMRCSQHHKETAEREEARMARLTGKDRVLSGEIFEAAIEASGINLALAEGLIAMQQEE